MALPLLRSRLLLRRRRQLLLACLLCGSFYLLVGHFLTQISAYERKLY